MVDRTLARGMGAGVDPLPIGSGGSQPRSHERSHADRNAGGGTPPEPAAGDGYATIKGVCDR